MTKSGPSGYQIPLGIVIDPQLTDTSNRAVRILFLVIDIVSALNTLKT